MALCGAVLTAGAITLAGTPAGAATTGTARPATLTLAGTRLAPGLTLSDLSGAGLTGKVLKADLTEHTLQPRYLDPGAVAARDVITAQADRAHAVAGVNGDYFDIDGVNTPCGEGQPGAAHTGAPCGIGISGGRFLHGPLQNPNHNTVMAIGANGRGSVRTVSLDGKIITRAGALTATNLNSDKLAANGIGIYTSDWGTVARSAVLDKETRTAAVTVTRGRVSAVGQPGTGAIPAGTDELLGTGAGADALATLKVGDPVSVRYRARGAEGVRIAVGGFPVLLRDGKVQNPPDEQKHPRTAVGFSKDGRTMWLVAFDGKAVGTGASFRQEAELLASLGATDAINLDGGGSTTLVAKLPGADHTTVQNVPSGGTQRRDANGFGFVSTARH